MLNIYETPTVSQTFGVPGPDFWIARSHPLAKEEARVEVKRLLQNPLELVHLMELPFDEIEMIYPGIFEGRYLGERKEPSKAVMTLLKFFGAEDDETLFDRAKKIIRAFFSTDEVAGELAISTLDFMRALHGKKERDSGELAICHETRIALRVLVQALGYRETTRATRTMYIENPYDPLVTSSLPLSAAVFSGIALHDAGEDYVDKLPISQIMKKGFSDVLKASTTSLPILNDDKWSRVVNFMVAAFTDKEFEQDILTGDEKALINLGRLLEYSLVRNGVLRHLISWGIIGGKAADRDDNISILWTYKGDKYLDKLIETLKYFHQPSLSTWLYSHGLEVVTLKTDHIKDPPMGSSTAFLRLLGATEDDLYGWVLSACEEKLQSLEEEGKEPLLSLG